MKTFALFDGAIEVDAAQRHSVMFSIIYGAVLDYLENKGSVQRGHDPKTNQSALTGNQIALASAYTYSLLMGNVLNIRLKSPDNEAAAAFYKTYEVCRLLRESNGEADALTRYMQSIEGAALNDVESAFERAFTITQPAPPEMKADKRTVDADPNSDSDGSAPPDVSTTDLPPSQKAATKPEKAKTAASG